MLSVNEIQTQKNVFCVLKKPTQPLKSCAGSIIFRRVTSMNADCSGFEPFGSVRLEWQGSASQEEHIP